MITRLAAAGRELVSPVLADATLERVELQRRTDAEASSRLLPSRGINPVDLRLHVRLPFGVCLHDCILGDRRFRRQALPLEERWVRLVSVGRAERHRCSPVFFVAGGERPHSLCTLRLHCVIGGCVKNTGVRSAFAICPTR